jgi:UDP-N-acetylmuramoylalanine--D-glutamate ligase
MELKGKKVLVVGLARTGAAAVRFLAGQGAEIRVSEARSAADIAAVRKTLAGIPVTWELGGHTLPFFLGADLIIVSPGVPMNLEVLAAARRKGIPVLSEVELAARFLQVPLIAVTGTNGKTTTTTLIGEMLRAAGKQVFVGGNIGNPLIEFVAGPRQVELVVAEISSFQLEGIETFRPRVAVLLNITEDHLDRYAGYGEYIEAKRKIFRNQGRDDYAVLNADDPLVFPMARETASRVVLFSARRPVAAGCFLRDGSIVFQEADGLKEEFSLASLKIRGAHNLENLMAAVAAAKICGASADSIRRVMNEFSGLEHRLEWVRSIGGVSFFNDSKGTNVGSVVKSLVSFPERILLIAGGRDKQGDYAPLKELVATRVKGMALIGEAQERMFAALGGLTNTVKVKTLEEAVAWSIAHAASGDVVLLSPACSSYDMFANYQERGRRFKEIVHALGERSNE